jgi:hypothetical protein
MHPLEEFEQKILAVFRMDLQLHFFWSLCLTLLAHYWGPMLYSGIIITVGKEFLDLLAKKGWSWGDFNFGMAGALLGIYLIGGI